MKSREHPGHLSHKKAAKILAEKIREISGSSADVSFE